MFRFILVFALVFEMPLVLIFLCRAGITSPKVLKKIPPSRYPGFIYFIGFYNTS